MGHFQAHKSGRETKAGSLVSDSVITASGRPSEIKLRSAVNPTGGEGRSLFRAVQGARIWISGLADLAS